MTQTVPATAQLGPGKTGLAIGYRVLNLDGTTYSAFSTTGVAETSTAGTYRKTGGVVCPAAGGYIVWGVSGTDYAEATVESTAVNVTYSAGVALSGRLAEVTDLPAEPDNASIASILEDTGTTLPALIEAIETGGGSLDLTTALEGTVTLGEALRVMLAALAGTSSGGGTATVRFKSVDEGTDRIVATVDGVGNRSAVTLDGAA